MRHVKVALMALLVVGIAFSLSFAGDVETGKAPFDDPALGGSTNDNSCSTCHPEGEGLERAGTKKSFMKGKITNLEDMVNACITGPLKGEAIATDSDEMKDIVSYIKSLKGKKKKKKAAVGC